MQSPVPADAIDLLLVIDDYAIGGVASLYSTIVAEAEVRGHRAVVIGRAGPARAELDWGGAETLEVSDWDAEARTQVARLAARSARLVWQTSPALVPVLVGSFDHHATALVVHGSAAVTSQWLGEDLLGVLRVLLQARPGLAVMAPSALLVPELSELLTLPEARFLVLSHVSRAPVRATVEPARPRPRVVVPTRLSQEKRFVIRAGVELARARQLPVTVVGEGPDVAWVERLGEETGVEVELVRDTRIHDHIAGDDVVVAVGLVALEAVSYCHAVVSAGRDDGIYAVATPDTASDLHAANFVGNTGDLDPNAAWALIDGLDHAARVSVREQVGAAADPGRAYGQLLAACDSDDGQLAADWLIELTRATAMAWLARSSADHAWIAELTTARDWLTEHRGELEAWVANLEEGLAFHRDRADALQRRHDAATDAQ